MFNSMITAQQLFCFTLIIKTVAGAEGLEPSARGFGDHCSIPLYDSIVKDYMTRVLCYHFFYLKSMPF